jgi:hypothetical protein
MHIKDKSPKIDPPKPKNKIWRAIGVLGVLAVVYLLGFISHPAWNAKDTIQYIKKILIKTDLAVKDDIGQEMGLYTANGLATLFLDIPFKSLVSIEEKRAEALATGILLTSDDDLVPATMHLNGDESFSIEIRLKGDWTDHLVGDKWSFRIHVDDPQHAILGMRRFSIQAPETRNYEKEWVYHQNLIQEGILAPRYFFVNVVLNGKYNGIYALEESFTEDLLESQGRREGPIIRYSEDLLWKNWENLGTVDSDVRKTVEQIGEFWLTDVENSEITAFRQNHLSKDELLTGELFTAINLLYSFNEGLLAGEEVFDLPLWGKYFALTDLWAAGHATAWHNLRFYYNPVTGLLEPVVFDAMPFEASETKEKLAFPFADQGYIQRIFRIPGVQESYVSNLERITERSYFEELRSAYGDELNHFHRVLTGYLEKGLFGDIPPLPWSDLWTRASVLSSNLESPQPIQGNYRVISQNNNGYLELDLNNLMVLPVEIQKLLVNGKSYQIQWDWCGQENCLSHLTSAGSKIVISENTSITLEIPLVGWQEDLGPEPEISITAVIWGGTTETANPLSRNYIPEGVDQGARPRASMEFVLENHPYLIEESPGTLRIDPGTWEINGDLILPDQTDLKIMAGTTLLFESGSVMVVDGSLDLEGSEEQLILLTSKGENWGGVVAFGNGFTESSWTHVRVENTAGVIRGGWVMTGGVTFYQNGLSLTQVTFSHNSAEDALNIIRADFALKQVEFLGTDSDAFDGDFTRGTVQDCSFENIAGDGLDFSGSTVNISQSTFRNIGDKAISAGEKSIIAVSASRIENSNIGIASKDLSEVSASDLEISNVQVAGLASYTKKPQYGPAYLNADQILLTDTEVVGLCQTGSTLIVDGSALLCEDLDVESLYAQGILGN